MENTKIKEILKEHCINHGFIIHGNIYQFNEFYIEYVSSGTIPSIIFTTLEINKFYGIDTNIIFSFEVNLEDDVNSLNMKLYEFFCDINTYEPYKWINRNNKIKKILGNI